MMSVIFSASYENLDQALALPGVRAELGAFTDLPDGTGGMLTMYVTQDTYNLLSGMGSVRVITAADDYLARQQPATSLIALVSSDSLYF